MIDQPGNAAALSAEQQAIVEWDEGPLVVVAGAGTGKTRVIVERVRRLLARHAGLVPEQILVLTYNVKAAAELGERLETALGPAVRARLAVSNFHSFCHRVLADAAAEAGLPPAPDVLDGVGQVLLLRDIRPRLPLAYFSDGNPAWALGAFVGFINRAKDELVSPDVFDRFVADEQAAFEERFGSHDAALEHALAAGRISRPQKDTRAAYARQRAAERAGGEFDDVPIWKEADREARRTVAGNGAVLPAGRLTSEQRRHAEGLAAGYVVEGAALEVLRLAELGLVYRAYEEERARRGALDFGEQIAATIRLFADRPNVLRRWQRQFRYLLVDEFQDANIAQIGLIEMLGRTPDRPDNVMVVGDDDQSIYRFRGASFAAFVEFDRRFGGPPAHDPGAPARGEPARLRLEENYRSRPDVLVVANRLIGRNELRYAPDKRLAAVRPPAGAPAGGAVFGDAVPRGAVPAVTLLTCAGPDDEAAAIVDRILALAGVDPGSGIARDPSQAVPWTRFAVLYRKHKHRDAILARLRGSGIPYAVSGGLSLFEAPEIRDLEAALRAICDPLDDLAMARVLTAGPWRLDALELLAMTRGARRAREPLFQAIRGAVGSGALPALRDVGDAAPGDGAGAPEPAAGAPGAEGAGSGLGAVDGAARGADAGAVAEGQRTLTLGSAQRAKLRRLLATLDALVPEAPREGPFTILERYLEQTGTLLDLLAADTLEARRAVANIASLLRFASDWQREHAARPLGAFLEYLDAYREAGGDLPTSVELADDVAGVRLMTLYQAKGLEYDHVFIPWLLDGEWPVREQSGGMFPRELLREAVPTGDIHTEEERRLLYVAITRARESLALCTHAGPTVSRSESQFVAELLDGAGPELAVVDRVTAHDGAAPDADDSVGEASASPPDEDGAAALERIVGLASPRERRTALRLRAVELLSMLEGVAPGDPEAGGARRAFLAQLARVGEAAIGGADVAREAGLDPLTLRVVSQAGGAGSSLLDVAPLPGHFSYSQFDAYERCPLRYAFQHVYRIPTGEQASHLTFGSAAHAAFERFTRERRERAARGEAPPSREDLVAAFAAAWKPEAPADPSAAESYRRRAETMLDAFWQAEVSTAGRAAHEELDFELILPAGPGAPPVRITGSIDRIDRLDSGGLEVIDYKTGSPASQRSVAESLQLSVYALACRDALGLGTPERVTLYFTESGQRMSTTRSDAELDAAREELLARARSIRSGDFHATPSARACGWCDWRRICPSRAVEPGR